MIAARMLSALLFGLFAAVGATCGERLLRSLGRQARGAWVAAIVAALAWPFIATPAGTSVPASTSAVTLPTIRVTSLVPASLAPTTDAWLPMLDRVLLATWIAASLLLAARLALALVRTERVRRRAERGAVDGVPLLISDGVGPAVLGIVRPEIVFPRALLSLEATLRDVIVRHELEHRDARDTWLTFGGSIALVLTPWNVALWWMVHRARLALEIDCDRRVLRAGLSPARYGKLLLLVSQSDHAFPFAPALVSSRTHLERRIHAMLATHSSNPRRRLLLGAGVLVAVVAACSSRVATGSAETTAASMHGMPRVTVAPSRAEPAPMPNAIARADTGTAKPQGSNYFEFQVDQQARQVPGTLHITYPAELKAAKVEGEVLAQFVVDTAGVPLPETFKVLKSSHALFSAAVKDALPGLRFVPARIGGRPVKQLIQQPFTFALSK